MELIILSLVGFFAVILIGYLIYKKWVDQEVGQTSKIDRLILWSQTISAALIFSLFYYLLLLVIFAVTAIWLGINKVSSPNSLGVIFMIVALCLGALTIRLIVQKAKQVAKYPVV